MAENLRLTEDGDNRVTEEDYSRILEDSDEGPEDMTIATHFQTAHVSIGTIKIKFGGFGQ